MDRMRYLARATLAAAAMTSAAVSAPALAQTSSQMKIGPSGSAYISFGPITEPMPICSTGTHDPDNVGVIRIRLPKKFDIDKLERSVKHTPGKFDEAVNDDGEDDFGGDKNEPNRPDPFHVYLNNLGYKPIGSPQFILVRVILRNDSDYRFYDENDIHGVGSSPTTNKPDQFLCGSRAIKPLRASTKPNSKPRKVASFFIDIEKILSLPGGKDYDGSFNLGIVPKKAPDTPIFIDPKVHNDG